MPMHDSSRDEVLDLIVSTGWANTSDGDTEAPTGHFALVTVTERELGELVGALESEFDAGYSREIVDELDKKELVGNFVVTKSDNGSIGVTAYDTEDEAKNAYAQLEGEYSEWGSDDPE